MPPGVHNKMCVVKPGVIQYSSLFRRTKMWETTTFHLIPPSSFRWAKRGNRSTVAHTGPFPRVVRLLGHTIPEDGRLRARIDGARRGARALHDGEGWWKRWHLSEEGAVFVGNNRK